MSFSKIIVKAIKSPKSIIEYLMATRPMLFSWMTDEAFVKFEYRLSTGKNLDLINPQRFNEKLQWLKLYDHNLKYTALVDKYEVKRIVSETIGTEYVIPTIGVWEKFEDIDFEDLPNQFILKCTHDSGGNVICHDKKSFNKKSAERIIKKCLKRRYYYIHREWPYKNIEPRIIAEPLLVDEPGKPLKDYKLFCFNGNTEFLFIASDRGHGTTKFDFFDKSFNKIPVAQHYPNSDYIYEKPVNFELMKELACKLSNDIPVVRVDFYDVKGQVYFGEFTFCHFSGNVPFEPDLYDFEFGKLISLSNYKKTDTF